MAYINMEVEVDVSEALAEINDEDLIQELRNRIDDVQILDELERDEIQEYAESHGLVSLTHFSSVELAMELELRGHRSPPPAEVVAAINALFDYFNPSATAGTRFDSLPQT